MITKHFFSNDSIGVGHWTNQKIKEYVHLKNEKVLDVGCGGRKINGAIGIDNDSKSKANIICDATKIPFIDNYFDTVFCLNFLEHTLNFNEVLTEIHRVLKPNGILHVEVPYYNSFNFAQVPFHQVMFCETTIQNFYTEKGEFSRYSKAKFEILETELFFTKPAKIIPEKIRVKVSHYIPNLCYQIYWKLRVVK